MAFGHGVPSHVHERNCTCEPLTEADLVDVESDGAHHCMHFLHLVQLTVILDLIVQEFFYCSCGTPGRNEHPKLMEVAKSIRTKLKKWHNGLPEALKIHASSDRLDMLGAPSRNLDGWKHLASPGLPHCSAYSLPSSPQTHLHDHNA